MVLTEELSVKKYNEIIVEEVNNYIHFDDSDVPEKSCDTHELND